MTGHDDPVRVIDLIASAAGHLKTKGFDNARLEVERLLGHVLGMTRIELYLSFEKIVSEEERALFRSLCRRRLGHEPLQHIIGTSGFHDITVKTDHRALIPRPETELLAELAVQELVHIGKPVFADLGTGSGVIALSILNAVPEARGVAIDLDAGALALAGENARLLGLFDRVTFVEADITRPLENIGPFDLVLSNPPYIPREDIGNLEPEVRDHEPLAALDGGVDGLDYYRSMTGYIQHLAKPGGLILFECGDGQALTVMNLLETTGRYETIETIRDLAGRERVVRGRTGK